MASIRRNNGKWRAEVALKGVRKSKVFATKTEAKDWANRQEYLIRSGAGEVSNMPFAEVLARYAVEVSSGKRGARWEKMRAEVIARDRIGEIPIGKLTQTDIADWRERRLKVVAPGTVRREMVFLGAVLTQARKEWRMISVSPMVDVRKPVEPPARDRLPTADELAKLAHVAGGDLSTMTARAFHAFLFAIETGMRAGEIVGLTWGAVDLDNRVARLDMTKNGTARDVPLSLEAVRLLKALPPLPTVFGLRSDQLDALWRKIRGNAGIEGLRFHDSRHEAVTRLSKKLDVLALAKMIGHRDIKQLQVYYNESAADLARRLD
jgi:integrase